MTDLGNEADAGTFVWDWVTGRVTRFRLEIHSDGWLTWSEEPVGQQVYAD